MLKSALLVTLLGFATLALAIHGYPQTTPDDIFFTGAAIELSRGGSLTNPYIPSWNSSYATSYFFFQPPLHSYVLAGWLRLVGISTVSMLSFQWIVSGISAISYGVVLRRFHVPTAVVLLSGWLFLVALLGRGLRYEPLAFGLLWSGLAVFRSGYFLRELGGLTLLGCSCIASPMSALFAAPLLLTLLLLPQEAGPRFPRRRLWALSVAGLAAFVITFLLFGVLISFHFQEFMRVFFTHAQNAQAQNRVSVAGLAGMFLGGWSKVITLPTYLLWVALLCVGLIRPLRREHRLFLIGSALAVGGYIIQYPIRGFHFAYPIAWLGILLIVSTRQRPGALFVLASLVFAGSCAPSIVALCFQRREASMNHQDVRSRVAALDPKLPLAIDSVASRYIFDYRLPPQAISWEFRYPPVGEGVAHGPDANPSGMVLVIQRNNPLLGTQKPTIVMGVTFRHIEQDPNEITVLVPE